MTSNLENRKLTFGTVLFLWGALLIGWPCHPARACPGKFQKASARNTRVAAGPSLDGLVSRVNAYWALLAKGEMLKALDYVESSSRENFLSRQPPAFSEPQIKALTLSAKPSEVEVTVEVRRQLQMLPAPVTWPVTEKWVYEDGNWMVRIDKIQSSFSSGPGLPPKPALSAEEEAKRKNSIRETLHFSSDNLDFGTVRKGESAGFRLAYELSGKDAYEVSFNDVPADLFIKVSDDGKLHPGKEQRIEMEMITANLQGGIDGKFTILVRAQDVEVPYDFSFHGFVYTPVAADPMDLRFAAGESVKELVVTNNSKAEVTLERARSQSGGFRVAGLPRTLPPSGSCTLKVETVLKGTEKNYRDLLSFTFAKPVEDMQRLTVPVILNYEAVKARDTRELLKSLRKKPGNE